MQPREVRLATWYRRSVYAAFAIVAATGIVWTFSHDLLHLGPNPLEHVMLEVHGAGAFLTLAFFGSLVPSHMQRAWVARRNRTSGALIVGCFVILAISAYGLYYIDEEARDFTKWLHIAIGVAGCAGMPVHIRLGRRSAPSGRGAHA